MLTKSKSSTIPGLAVTFTLRRSASIVVVICKLKKPKLNLAAGESEPCPVYDQTAYIYKTKDGRSGMNQKAVGCPKFKASNIGARQQLLTQNNRKIGFQCKHCSSFTHESEDCYKKFTNCRLCQDSHIQELHKFQSILSCSLTSIVAPARMSLQDIEIIEGAQ